MTQSDFTKGKLALFIIWIAPLALIAIQIVLRLADSGQGFYKTLIETEYGLVETATALALVPAVIYGLIAAKNWFSSSKPLAIWYVLVAALAFMFLGEEISWGQHWLGFDSPEYFAENNRQGETNLHNLHLQLGRVIKTLITVAIIIAGLIVPLSRRRANASNAFWPGMEAVPTTVFVVLVRLVERFITWFDWEGHVLLTMNLKETQEFYIAWFFLVYLWAAAHRARAQLRGETV